MLAPLVAALAFSIGAAPVDDPAALLPPDTLLYFGTHSVRAASENSRNSAMSLILGDPEVREFLRKPLAAADKALQQMLKEGQIAEEQSRRFTVASIMGQDGAGAPVGKLFIALTHLGLPQPTAEGMGEPDIGLVVGVELLDSQDLALIRTLWDRIPLPEETVSRSGREVLVKTSSKGVPIQLTFVGNLAVMALSEASLQAVLDRSDPTTKAASLAGAADYKALLGSSNGLVAGASSWIVRVGKLGTLARAGLGLAMMASEDLSAEQRTAIMTAVDGLGLEDLPWVGAVSHRTVDGKVHTTTALAAVKGSQKLIPRMLAGATPIDLALLESVPSESLSMTAASVDGLSALFDYARDTFAAIAPEESAAFDAQVGAFLGDFDLREDVIANPHGVLLSYTVPGEGFPGMPATIHRVALRDPQRFMGAIETAITKASESVDLAKGLELVETEHEGRPLYEIDVSGSKMSMFAAGMHPTLALDGNDLVACFASATALKTALNGLEGRPALSGNKEFVSFLAGLRAKGSLVSASYTDLAKSFGAAYGQVAPMVGMFSGAIPPSVPLDMALLPSEQALTKHLGVIYAGSIARDDGVHIGSSVGQFEAGDFLPLLAVAGLVFAGNNMFGSDYAAEPEEVDPVKLAERDLGSLRAATSVYKADQRSYPASLEDLVKPLPTYPSGCLGRAHLPMDPWGNAYLYRLDEKGKPVVWSSGPNGIDEGGAGDDIVKKK